MMKKENKQKKSTENEKIRAKSRKIVLDYLADNCQKVYKLGGWDNVYQKVDKYIKQKEEIEQSESSNKKIELEQAKSELFKTIKGSEVKMSQLLKDLIKRCWNAEPSKRPTVNEIVNIARKWQKEISLGDSEFKKQLQEAEDYNQTLADEVRFPKYETHSQNTYTSKAINTKQITELLESKNIALVEIKENQLQANIEQPPQIKK